MYYKIFLFINKYLTSLFTATRSRRLCHNVVTLQLQSDSAAAVLLLFTSHSDCRVISQTLRLAGKRQRKILFYSIPFRILTVLNKF